MTERRVLVCGSRDYQNAAHVWRVLDDLSPQPTVIIHGDYRGADTLAKRWAIARFIPDLPFPADWIAYGRGAGPRRNQRMIDEGKPDLVVAFPGAAGTRDLVFRAREAGIPVISVE